MLYLQNMSNFVPCNERPQKLKPRLITVLTVHIHV